MDLRVFRWKLYVLIHFGGRFELWWQPFERERTRSECFGPCHSINNHYTLLHYFKQAHRETQHVHCCTTFGPHRISLLASDSQLETQRRHDQTTNKSAPPDRSAAGYSVLRRWPHEDNQTLERLIDGTCATEQQRPSRVHAVRPRGIVRTTASLVLLRFLSTGTFCDWFFL